VAAVAERARRVALGTSPTALAVLVWLRLSAARLFLSRAAVRVVDSVALVRAARAAVETAARATARLKALLERQTPAVAVAGSAATV
jgi:hypothetical protein